jgi:DNA polymerase elongation subunit (family B)
VKKKEPRIILWDIETLPDLRAVMNEFPSLSAYPGLTLKASINSVICVGWKVLGESKVHCINAWDFKTRWKRNINDDFDVCKAAFEILSNADVVVTHNGKRFDWKFMQTRLLYHGFPPLPNIIHIDTCSEAKKHLFMYNNRLNTIGKFLTSEQKLENGGWGLWVKVSERNPKAMAVMTKYCMQDVRLLEKVFKKLKPVIRGLPNANLYKDRPSCPNCGSKRLQKRGEKVTKTARAQRYQCQDCGSWSSAGKQYPKGE